MISSSPPCQDFHGVDISTFQLSGENSSEISIWISTRLIHSPSISLSSFGPLRDYQVQLPFNLPCFDLTLIGPCGRPSKACIPGVLYLLDGQYECNLSLIHPSITNRRVTNDSSFRGAFQPLIRRPSVRRTACTTENEPGIVTDGSLHAWAIMT